MEGKSPPVQAKETYGNSEKVTCSRTLAKSA